MDFERICMAFSMQEPYYGIILSSMLKVANERVKTIAVTQSGNVFKLQYSPSFIDSLPLDTVLELLKHETMHIAFNHFTLWDGQDLHDTPPIRHIRNIAEDLEINCYLDRSKIAKEAGGCFVEDLGFPRELGAREYFRLLLQQAQNNQKATSNDPDKPCNGGSARAEGQDGQPQSDGAGNSGNGSGGNTPETEDDINQEFVDSLSTFDDHSQWPDSDDIDPEMLKQIVDDMLVFAAEEVEKGQGTIPGEMKGRIDVIRSKKARPVADWKRYFRRYLGNEFSELFRKSKKRESKRFPDAPGNRHRRKSNILVAIDTSGSVSMPEYLEFFGQIATLSQAATFHVLECDARIQYEYDFKHKPPTTLHGGGGTNFQPVVNYYNENRKKYDALVYFTDGYSSIPKDTPKDTLWVISSNGDHNRKKYTVNGANVVFIPQHS